MAIELSELIEKRGPKMAEQLCPVCGCTIGDEAHERVRTVKYEEV